MSDLTDNSFWDQYWEKSKDVAEVSKNFSFERCLMKFFEKYLEPDKTKTIFEIGCAPGRWLIFFNTVMEYGVYGLDNSEKGVSLTLNNLQSKKIDAWIENEDVLNYRPKKQFDTVISLGFIEHFTGKELERVLDTHVKLTKIGGKLLVGVPNFRGINEIIQRRTDNEILECHNLEIMSIKFFESLAKKYGLKMSFVGYIGSFEPTLFIFKNKNRITNIIIRAFLKIFQIIRRIEALDGINSPVFSSYLIAVYEKPGNRND